MKTRRLIVVLIALLACLMLWFLWSRQIGRNTPMETVGGRPAETNAQDAERGTDGAVPKTPPPVHEIDSSASNVLNGGLKNPLESMRQITSQQNPLLPAATTSTGQSPMDVFSQQVHQPIEFYGKVLDENEQPVEGASVTLGWTHLVVPETSYATNIQSDSQGNFTLSGVVGARLTVKVSKEGYYNGVAGEPTSFSYSQTLGNDPFRPDPQNPVVFHLRKQGAVEPLIARNVTLPASRDGETTGFDPFQCKLSPDGPLFFRFKSGDHGLMKLEIQINGGGIQAASGQFPFEAPESGYTEALVFNEAEKKELPSQLQCYFYFGNPRQYGRLKFSKSALSGSSIGLTCWVNPSGSRNLEFEPGKFIQPVPDYYLRPNTPLIDSIRSK